MYGYKVNERGEGREPVRLINDKYPRALVKIRALALKSNTIVGTRMVFGVTNEDVRNITNAALFVGVILAGALFPAAVIVNVGFPRWVVVP